MLASVRIWWERTHGELLTGTLMISKWEPEFSTTTNEKKGEEKEKLMSISNLQI